MTGQCCAQGATARSAFSRLSRVGASMLPAAVLVLLPKCPLCLAAWLTIATGVSFSAAGAAWVRGSLVLLWIAGLVWAAARSISRRAIYSSNRVRVTSNG